MKTAIIARNAALDAALALANSGSLKFRTGSMPSTPESSLTGTLLGTLPLSATAFAAAASGVATANTITSDTSADATGTIGYCAMMKSDGTTCVALLTVGTSGADVNLNTLDVLVGQQISVTSFSITAPQ